MYVLVCQRKSLPYEFIHEEEVATYLYTFLYKEERYFANN